MPNISSTDTLQILSSVDNFYFHAWSLLMIAISGLIVGVGIVMPLVVQRLQRRMFKEHERKLRRVFADEIAKVKAESEQRIKAAEERVQAQEAGLMQANARMRSSFCFTQGTVFQAIALSCQTGGLPTSYVSTQCSALSAFLEAGTEYGVRNAAESISEGMRNLNKVHFGPNDTLGQTVAKTLADLDKANEGGKYQDVIDRLRGR